MPIIRFPRALQVSFDPDGTVLGAHVTYEKRAEVDGEVFIAHESPIAIEDLPNLPLSSVMTDITREVFIRVAVLEARIEPAEVELAAARAEIERLTTALADTATTAATLRAERDEARARRAEAESTLIRATGGVQ